MLKWAGSGISNSSLKFKGVESTSCWSKYSIISTISLFLSLSFTWILKHKISTTWKIIFIHYIYLSSLKTVVLVSGGRRISLLVKFMIWSPFSLTALLTATTSWPYSIIPLQSITSLFRVIPCVNSYSEGDCVWLPTSCFNLESYFVKLKVLISTAPLSGKLTFTKSSCIAWAVPCSPFTRVLFKFAVKITGAPIFKWISLSLFIPDVVPSSLLLYIFSLLVNKLWAN